MTDKQELLPCPLCRSAVELVLDHTTEQIDWIRHVERSCGVEFSGARGEVAAAWNHRTPDPELAKVTAERDEALTRIEAVKAELTAARHLVQQWREDTALMGFSETCRPRRSSGPSTGHQDMNGSIRKRLEAALAKPLPEGGEMIHSEVFSPWQDVISGIDGGYSSESDDLMIAVLEAIRDSTTFELIELRGFAAELALYVLSGHGFTQYGTSPRGAWPRHEIEDLWQPLIDKWIAYRVIAWDEA